MTSLRRRGAALGVLVLALLGGACGEEEVVVEKPSSVPDGLVPEKIQGDKLAFYENTNDSVKDTFANAGKESLAADGRMWELRNNDRLVGTLQISTLMPEVKLENKRHREQILRQIMPATVDELSFDETVVWTTGSADKNLYLWFGEETFAVLTLKGGEEDLDADAVISEVIGYTTTSDNWQPLYIDDEEESEA